MIGMVVPLANLMLVVECRFAAPADNLLQVMCFDTSFTENLFFCPINDSVGGS